MQLLAVRGAPPQSTSGLGPEPQVGLGSRTPETVGRAPEVPPPASPPDSYCPPVFDSHFHLDRLGTALRQRGAASTSGRAPRVRGGRDRKLLRSYCDPVTFGQVNWSLRPGFGVAVGIHHKHAPVSSSQWAEFIRLVCDPRVRAISEVGLDHSVKGKAARTHQLELLHRILSMGTMGRVLVVHLRGAPDDPLGRGVYSRCREILARRCVPQQQIHVHYCTADVGEIANWQRSFPQAHFGFMAAVRTSSDAQRAGLRSVPLDRLLLETDSPHVRVDSGVKANTPDYLGEVGQLVADIRGETKEKFDQYGRNHRR